MSTRSSRARLCGVTLMLAGFVSLGCGGGGRNPAGPGLDMTGTWGGAFFVHLGTGGEVNLDVTMELTQIGDSLTGTYIIDAEHFGTIIGAVDGNSAVGALIQQAGCPGSFEGTAVISSDGNSMEGDFDGNDCHNTHSGGLITATRH